MTGHRRFMPGVLIACLALAGTAGVAAIPGRIALAAPPVARLQVGGGVPRITVQAHQGFMIDGFGYASGEQVRITAHFPLYNGNTVAVTRFRQANSSGNFYNLYLAVPAHTRAATSWVVGNGQSSGRRAQVNLDVTYHPSVKVVSGSLTPGSTVTIKGYGFVSYVTVRVTLTLNRTDASPLTLTRTPFSDRNGSFQTTLTLPSDMASGTYTLNATGTMGGLHAASQLTMATSSGNNGSSSSGNSGNPQPPASGPPPSFPSGPHAPRVQSGFGFRYISLWYHTVQVGTWDHVDIQAGMQTTLGIWVHVIFASGQHFDYYTNTDGNGHWSKSFSVPKDSKSKYSNQAVVIIQLWHGKQTVKDYLMFTLV